MGEIFAFFKAKLLIPIAMAVTSSGITYARNYMNDKPNSISKLIAFTFVNVFLMWLLLEAVDLFIGPKDGRTFYTLSGIVIGVFSVYVWDGFERLIKTNVDGFNAYWSKFWGDKKGTSKK